MKIIGFRLKKGTVVLFLLIMFLTISTLLVLYNMDSRDYLNKLSRGFLTENFMGFSIFDSNDNEKGINESIIACISGGMEKETVVIKSGIDYTYDVRGIIYKGDAELPPLISGNFLDENECITTNMTAVIGTNLSKDIYDSSGKKCINIGKRVFEVKGIVGGKEQGRLDNMVYIPLGTALEISAYSEGDYSLDGKGDLVSKSIETIRKLLSDINIDMAVQNDNVVESKSDERINQIYFGLFAAFILAILSGMGYWLSGQTERIEFERIMGAENIRIFTEFVYFYIRIWLTAFLAGVTVSFILYKFGMIYLLSTKEYFVSGLITFLPGFITVIWYIFRILVLHIRKKRRNMLADVILIAQFALFFLLFGQTSTYYINITTQTWVQNLKLGHRIYTMQESDNSISPDAASTVVYNNMREALNEIQSTDGFEYMNLTTCSLSVNLEEKYIREHFGNVNLNKYTNAAQAFQGIDDDVYDEMFEDAGKMYLPFALCQIDYNAAKFYINKADEGRTFEKEDFNYRLGDKDIPVMLGHQYRKYFKINDILPFKLGMDFEAKVIGFLPENTVYETDLTGVPMVLDYFIILPYFNVDGYVTNHNEDVFMLYNYGNSANGMLVFEEDTSDRKILNAQKEINDIYRKWNLNTAITLTASPGIMIFQSETRKSVNLLFSLLLIVAFAGIVALCMSLINKLNLNMKKYAIWILNGCHLRGIIMIYISNILVLVGVAIIVAGCFLRIYIRSNIQFLWLLLAESAMIIIPCVIVLIRRISKIDIENIMRKFD